MKSDSIQASIRTPVVFALICALFFSVQGRGELPDTAKKPAAEKATTPEKVEKKDDEKKTLDTEYASQYLLALSSAVGALIAIQTIPTSVKASIKAVDGMRHFTKHNATFLRLKAELKVFEAQKPEKLAELKLALGRYRPALNELDAHVRSVLGEKLTNLPKRYLEVEKDLVRLSEMPEVSRWKTELDAALAGWRSDRRSFPIESWIGKHLTSSFLKSEEGIQWLRDYTTHQKELAAAFWLEKGSALLLDQWLDRNKTRKMVFGTEEQTWQSTLTKLKGDEEKAANIFVREFATFTRDLNAGITDPTHQFSELLTWANREPGVFHSSDNGRPVPIAAGGMDGYAEARCEAGMSALSGAVALARANGSYLTLPWQGLKAIAPVASAGATVASGYISVRSLVRVTAQVLPSVEEPAPKK